MFLKVTDKYKNYCYTSQFERLKVYFAVKIKGKSSECIIEIILLIKTSCFLILNIFFQVLLEISINGFAFLY